MNYITVKGAREHNLKNIDVKIPRDKLVVITGLSGSGKSSLAFDTIYAEGQRRYVESLSSYARLFFGQMDKPAVDSIDGLSPAISIDQKTTSRNPRSTVGTVTEIHDYLRLVYARAGIPYCVKCGKRIERQTVDQIIDEIKKMPEGSKVMIMSPVVSGRKGQYTKVFEDLSRSGYTRVIVDGITYMLDEEISLDKNKKHTIDVVVDRLVLKDNMDTRLHALFKRRCRKGARHRKQQREAVFAELRVHRLRHKHRRDIAEDVFFQRSLRGMPALPRPRDDNEGRRRPRRARQNKIARRRRGARFGLEQRL